MKELEGIVILVITSYLVATSIAAPPNILYILSDDIGWNGVSWHNSEVVTPSLQELVDGGVLLEQYYTNSLCTPSRSSLLTGNYAYKMGRQRIVIYAADPTGLSMNYTLLPERLKDAGYATHLVGKWHLGFCNWSYTPTYRGFDSFYGFYKARDSYFYHSDVEFGGYDLRDNEEVAWSDNGTYSMNLFTDRAIEVIRSHESSDQPFFLYLAPQSVHSPYEVPPKYEDFYPQIADERRRKYLAAVTAMDEGIGRVLNVLKETGKYNNTIIVWSTDNGGVEIVPDNNTPLRGWKATMMEGGSRVPAIIHSPLLESTPRVEHGLVHVVDWHNTLLSAIGITDLPNNDGLNQWEYIRTGTVPSPRKEFIYNLDDMYGTGVIDGGIRVGKWKFVMGWMMYTNETGPWLFNLEDDPNETTNLYEIEPVIAAQLEARLLEELPSMLPADTHLPDLSCDPANFGGAWSPGWCDAK
ncbi:hypothetical protein SK128_013340 [Halocaridina rubra]|uniref:Sulfatase N-terminal domain-containing protein n=1 Tax=Halocaridina rubra TaxID=373956 RepID=A0AAN8XC21_HALRR